MPPPALPGSLTLSCMSMLASTASVSHPTSSMMTKTHPLSPHTHLLDAFFTVALVCVAATVSDGHVAAETRSRSAIACVEFPNSLTTTTTVALSAGVSTSLATSTSTPMIALAHESRPAPNQAAGPFPFPKPRLGLTTTTARGNRSNRICLYVACSADK